MNKSDTLYTYSQLPVLIAWVVVLLLSKGCLSAQTIRQDTVVSFTPRDSLLIKQVTCKRISNVHLYEKENLAYHRFRERLTTNQLDLLTDHADACVRAYAFAALTAREYDKIEKIIDKHITDTVYIDYLVGDVVDKVRIINFMMMNASLDFDTQTHYATKVSKVLDKSLQYKIELPEITIDPEELEEDSIR